MDRFRRFLGACLIAALLPSASCALQRTFGLDSAGKLITETYPTEPDRVQLLRPPSDYEDAYRMLMLRCAAVEAEQTQVLRRAYFGRVPPPPPWLGSTRSKTAVATRKTAAASSRWRQWSRAVWRCWGRR
jgi:hypothetical protein